MSTSNPESSTPNRLDGDIASFDLDAVIGPREGNSIGSVTLFGRQWSVRNDPDGLLLMKFMAGKIDQNSIEIYGVENMVIDEEMEDWAEARATNSAKLNYKEWQSLGANVCKMWFGIPLEFSSSSKSGLPAKE